MKKKQLFKKFILLLSVILLMLIFGELFLRMIGIVDILIAPPGLYKRSENKQLGYINNPGFKGKANGVEVKINSYGFRDKEYSVEKDKDTFRILILGDSVTFGFGVGQDEKYPEILEQILNSQSEDLKHDKYEVINAGTNGYYTQQELELFKEKGLKFCPDLCILQVNGNDFRNNIEFFVDEDGYLSVNHPKNKLHRFLRRIKRKSHLLTLVQKISHISISKAEKRNSFSSPTSAWEKFGKKNLENFIVEIQKQKVPIIVFMDFSLNDPTRAEMSELLDIYNVPCFDTADSIGFQWEEDYEKIYKLPNDPHPNAFAHKKIAEDLLQKLKAFI